MISILNKFISINNKTIFRSPDSISITHIFNDKILFLYEPYSLIPRSSGFQKHTKVESQENLQEVNRNILMIDFNGNVLWRIQSSVDHYNPWTFIDADENNINRWYVANGEGYQFDIDINTGKLSNEVFAR